jgi:hypothetical protein
VTIVETVKALVGKAVVGVEFDSHVAKEYTHEGQPGGKQLAFIDCLIMSDGTRLKLETWAGLDRKMHVHIEEKKNGGPG